MSDPVEQPAQPLSDRCRRRRSFLPFGAGFGTFDPVYRRFEPDALLSTIYLNQAHNEPMQLAMEGGIPALALLLVFPALVDPRAFQANGRKSSAPSRALGNGDGLCNSDPDAFQSRRLSASDAAAERALHNRLRRADPFEAAGRRAAAIVRQSLAGRLLRKIVARRGSIIAPLSKGWQREREIIAETRARTQLLLTDPAALHIPVCARAARALPGAFAEAGVFKGGSARLICEEKADARYTSSTSSRRCSRARIAGADVRAHFSRFTDRSPRSASSFTPIRTSTSSPGFFPDTTRGLEQSALRVRARRSRPCRGDSRRRSIISIRGWCRAGSCIARRLLRSGR